jgi:hypothetical protein
VTSNVRQKRQEEDADEDDRSVDELCENRPPDEYFRLSTGGDCRDVVRYNEITEVSQSRVMILYV